MLSQGKRLDAKYQTEIMAAITARIMLRDKPSGIARRSGVCGWWGGGMGEVGDKRSVIHN